MHGTELPHWRATTGKELGSKTPGSAHFQMQTCEKNTLLSSRITVILGVSLLTVGTSYRLMYLLSSSLSSFLVNYQVNSPLTLWSEDFFLSLNSFNSPLLTVSTSLSSSQALQHHTMNLIQFLYTWRLICLGSVLSTIKLLCTSNSKLNSRQGIWNEYFKKRKIFKKWKNIVNAQTLSIHMPSE